MKANILTRQHPLPLLAAFLVLTLCFCTSSVYAKVEANHIRLKVNFIIEVAQSLSYEKSNFEDSYKIGVFGRGREIKALLKELNAKKAQLYIGDKPVEIINFKRVKNVEPVDLLFVSGNTKIRLNDLNERLKDSDYLLLTENYPFGTSALNFTIDESNEIIYEIQETVLKNKGVSIKKKILRKKNRISSSNQWKKRLLDAMKVIGKQNEMLGEKEQVITENELELEENQEMLGKQNITLNAQTKIISNQKTIIIITVIFIIVILIVLFVLFRINQLRKAALLEVEEKNRDIIASLNYAKEIQKVMLPTEHQLGTAFNDHFMFYQPKDIVSGDFYWMERVGDKLFIAVADCTGHGVPGAFLSIICCYALTKVVKELGVHNPAKILDKTSSLLKKYFAGSEDTKYDGMDLALFCIDKPKNELYFAGAYNPLHYFKDGALHTLQADRQPIGLFENRKPYSEQTLSLKDIQSLYLFSDGYSDQFGGERNKKFSKGKFRKLLVSIQDEKMSDQKLLLKRNLDEWCMGQEQIDDISVMGISLN